MFGEELEVLADGWFVPCSPEHFTNVREDIGKAQGIMRVIHHRLEPKLKLILVTMDGKVE